MKEEKKRKRGRESFGFAVHCHPLQSMLMLLIDKLLLFLFLAKSRTAGIYQAGILIFQQCCHRRHRRRRQKHISFKLSVSMAAIFLGFEEFYFVVKDSSSRFTKESILLSLEKILFSSSQEMVLLCCCCCCGCCCVPFLNERLLCIQDGDRWIALENCFK